RVLALPLDARVGPAEVVAGAQLLGGLVQGVVHLLAVELRDDVERGLRGHGRSPVVGDVPARLPARRRTGGRHRPRRRPPAAGWGGAAAPPLNTPIWHQGSQPLYRVVAPLRC